VVANLFLGIHQTYFEPIGVVVGATQRSLSEGESILEAMALASPVVRHRMRGVPKAPIDRLTAILVPPADSSGLATAMLRPLNSRSMRRELGEAALDRLKAILDQAYGSGTRQRLSEPDIRSGAARIIGLNAASTTIFVAMVSESSTF
jgi:glycosyltransferase involved in cell wall biosynthesis